MQVYLFTGAAGMIGSHTAHCLLKESDCKIIILDKRCSIQMRENVEYAICKIFNVYYNKELNSYISKLGEENV